jgi:hypothetical protein
MSLSITEKEKKMEKETLEKIFEYASMPVHGTLSRKIRKDVKIQVNDGKVYESAVLFLGDGFVRITEQQEKEAVNTYYSWNKIGSIRTFGKTE